MVAIVIAFACTFLRMYMLNRMINFPLLPYLKMLVNRVLVVGIVSAILPVLIITSMTESLIRLLLTSFIALISTLFSAFYIGSSRSERNMVMAKAKSIIVKRVKK